MGKPRKIPRSFSMPWGNGKIVQECAVDSEHNEVVIQLMRYDDLEHDTVRFCQYWPDGRFQRQPMMLSVADIPAMREALKATPEIRALLKQLVED
jgi:hypothetical protein